MLNYEEELKKFKPSLEVEEIEEAVYQEDLSDMTDLLKQVMASEEMTFVRKIVVSINGLREEDRIPVQLLV